MIQSWDPKGSLERKLKELRKPQRARVITNVGTQKANFGQSLTMPVRF